MMVVKAGNTLAQEREENMVALRTKIIQARAARRMGDQAGVELIHVEIDALLDKVMESPPNPANMRPSVPKI